MSLIPFEIYQGSKKRILLTGGTGFIGKRLIQILMYLKHDVTLLVRNIKIASTKLPTEVNFITQFSEITDEAEFDVIINLAGEPLAKGRWTKQRKAIFVNSRLNITAGICELVKRLKHKPDVLINGSAIGYYGPHQDEVLDENGAVVHCFSHELCRQWEEQALKVEAQGIRVCL